MRIAPYVSSRVHGSPGQRPGDDEVLDCFLGGRSSPRGYITVPLAAFAETAACLATSPPKPWRRHWGSWASIGMKTGKAYTEAQGR